MNAIVIGQTYAPSPNVSMDMFGLSYNQSKHICGYVWTGRMFSQMQKHCYLKYIN